MCGRYVVKAPPMQLALEFGADTVDNAEAFAPDYNVAPTTRVPAVLVDDGATLLTRLRWGLVPSWAKDPSIGARMINARVETVAEKPAFRGAFAKRRCLVPADGYYEWLKAAEGTGSGGSRAPKQPFYIHRTDGGILAFAGLYERWRDAAGAELRSVSIITGAAVAPFDRVHDRMPLTVPAPCRAAWLDPELTDRDAVRGLLDFAPRWSLYPVATTVNSVRNNGPELTAPLPGGTPGGMPGESALF
jgi:putative SOS response-associated peptidase YedK